jgi:predicted RNA-binding protein YlqC (UPF0109 family)
MDNLDVKELLRYIICKLVDNPDDVEITEIRNSEDSITFQVKLNSQDMGKVIGRQGRIAKEIRTIVKSVGMRSNTRVDVTILD